MRDLKSRKRKWKSLDSISLSSLRFKSALDQDTVLFVNSLKFFSTTPYQLQNGDNRYSVEGMMEQAWNWIYQKKYHQAQTLIDEAISYQSSSSSLYFAKFVVMLLMGKDASSYLRKCIETKRSSENDDEYRILLTLYNKIEPDSDFDMLIDSLAPSQVVVAFHKYSYNRYYLDFLDFLSSEKYKQAISKLEKCKKMKPDYFYLEIVQILLNLLLKKEEDIKKKQVSLEKELEKGRFQKFIDFLDDKDFERAKSQLQLIIAYRNQEQKNNYVYQLLLEPLEMITTLTLDKSFDVSDMNYQYHNEKDLLYTFYETISNGDFRKTLEIAKKCRGKVLDPAEPKLKVGLYLTILQNFFEQLNKVEQEREHLYHRIKNNIQRGHYIHAFEIYDKNKFAIKNYQEELVRDLFECGIAIEKKEFSYHQTISYEDFDEELEEIPIEVRDQDSLIEEEVISKLEKKIEPSQEESMEREEVLEQVEPLLVEKKELSTEKLEDKKIEQFYPVEPLLNHLEPNHPYFLNHLRCLQQGSYEESKYWLTQYGGLLRANRLQKRLDHYYYCVEVAYMESLEERGLFQKKEELYQYAYSAMRNYEYEKAITYLEYYEKIDTCRNHKASVLKGVCYSKLGKYAKAIPCFISANAISPNPDSYYFLGELYYKQKKWKDAIFCYLTYNEFYEKETITVYLNLSECYRRLENYDKALKYLRIADEIDVGQGIGMNLKSRILRIEMLNERKRDKILLENEIGQ